MNKMTFKSKLFLSIVLIFVVVLSALITYTYAIPNDPTNVEGQQIDSYGQGNPAPGFIKLSDLQSRYDILCCERGVHLPSDANVTFSDGGRSGNFGEMTANDLGKQIFMTGWTTSPSNPYSGGNSETYGYYTVSATHICTPKEAYIIAEMIRNDSYPAEVQYAWWSTMFGGGGTEPTINTDLENEANAFEAYIAQVASTDPSTFVDTQYTYTQGGTTHTGTVKAPVIKYEPSYNEDANQDGEVNSYDSVTVSWNNDIQRYVIGPFSIDYVEAKGQFGSREPVMFAGITHATLFTELGEVDPSQWDFEWTDLDREESDYPHPNEVFYIDMDFIPNAKYFKNLHFDFVYMNAGAEVDQLKGQYFKCTWTPKYDYYVEEEEDGSTTVYYRYWDELTSMVPQPSQTLCYGVKGARWNNTAELDWEGDEQEIYHTGKIILKKVVLDENGNEMQSNGDKFTFKINVNGEISTVKLKAGQTWTSSLTWKDGDPVPTYSVTETEIPDGYKLIDIINQAGSFDPNHTISIVCRNQVDTQNGELEILKEVSEPAVEDEVYKFAVYINDKLYTTVLLTVPQGQTTASAVIDDITWAGKTAPSYKVEEIEVPSFVRGITYTGQTGQLKPGAKCTVKAVNDTGYNHGVLRIVKTCTDVSTQNEVYKFRVKVAGFEDEIVTITVPAGQTSSSWEKTYEWRGNDTRTYSVEEVEIPDFVTNVTYTNKTGRLSDDSTMTVTALNHLRIQQQSRIKILKTVSDPAIQDEVYKFKVHVDGFTDEIVEILVPAGETHGEGVTNQVYTWYSNELAPQYKVTEIEIPAGYVVTMTGDEGRLVANTVAETTVSAYNAAQIDQEGSIVIKKVVEGSVEPNTEFTYHIRITDAEGVAEDLYVKTRANQEVKIKRAWKHNQAAPTYSIEEIDIPEGYKFGSIDKPTGSFVNASEINVTVTNYGKVQGTLTIKKEVVGKYDINQLFKFKVTVTTADGTETYINSIKAGEYWNLTQEWYKGDTVPTYKVEEIELPAEYKIKEIQNAEGNFEENRTTRIIATNYGIEQGRLRVTKKIENATDDSTLFNFRATIGDNVYVFSLRAGYSWESELINWNAGDEAPDYTVEEIDIPSTYKLNGITNSSGKLQKNSVVVATATNEAIAEHQGQLALTKRIIVDDKVKDDAVEGTFKFKITISGKFEIGGKQVDGSEVIETSLSADQTYTSPVIKWKGETAPIFSIAETDLPEGWSFDSMTKSTGLLEEDTTTNVTCVNRFKSYLEYELTMEMGGIVWLDEPLNVQDKNTPDSVPNGIYDQGKEEGIEKAEVRIFRYLTDEDGNNPQLTGYAVAYDENDNPIEWPVYTEPDGTWIVPKVEIQALKEGETGIVKYGVEFGFDGQTYEATDFLVTGNGDANAYKKATRAGRNKFLFDSHAIESEQDRDAFNRKFYQITGDQAMQDDYTTQGYTIGADGQGVTLEYAASDSMALSGATRKQSTLITRDSQNYVYQKYIMKASTTLARLLYPFDTHTHLLNINKTLVTSGEKIGLHKKYTYSATYPYTQSINLGLVKRKQAELAATKDVYSATVAIDQKLMLYKYNEAIDFENVKYQDYLNLQTQIENAGLEYTLDLFKTDYYYRAAIYQDASNNPVVGRQLENFYKSLGYSDLSNELDLDVYVTYKLSVYNDSEGYYATINELADYFDDDYELVATTVDRYIQEANGVSVNRVTDIAESPFYKKAGGQVNGSQITWGEEESKHPVTWSETGTKTGSDGTVYHRMTTTSLKGEMLAPNERINVYVTFRVKTDAMDIEGYGIGNSMRMGKKANICEISNYSTYNSADKNDIAGKVDKDSAPNNINIENHNEKSWYEDDTDSAPTITLTLYTINREVNGLVWEDSHTSDIQYGQKVGNGKLDRNESTIAGLTTELWEKVRVKNVDEAGNVETDSDGNPIYTDYDFLWPEDYVIEGSGHTLKEVTGFDSTIKTDANGEYGFTGVPTGNYVVRFTYGDDNEAIANPHGVEIRTADYDKDQVPAVYNGQDFKSSTYQPEFESINTQNGYVSNEWHDLENEALANVRINDARDSEARRLEITSKSRYLTNANTTVMNSANYVDNEHNDLRNELYQDYYMTADTAKINLNIENMPSLKKQQVRVMNPETGAYEEVLAGDTVDVGGLTVNYVKGKVKLAGGSETDSLDFTYTVKNVDFAIEERASTEIKLDKQIENITVRNNTGDVILNADYNIEYKMDYNVNTGKATMTPKVTLNEQTAIGTDNLQALNKDESRGLQNFRYINYDTSMAQSLTLDVTYKMTIFNLGEVDRVGHLSEERFEDPAQILALSSKVGEQRYTYNNGTYTKTPNADGNVYGDVFGFWMGRVYYKGDKLSQDFMNEDDIVETRVDQLVDYVDNDAVFEQVENMAVNNSWRPVTIEELLDENTSPIIARSIIEEIDGVMNIQDSKGNVYVTTQKDNIVLSLDETADKTQDTLNNRDFTIRTVPYAIEATGADVNNKIYTTEMRMVMSRSIDSQINDDNAAFDNVAEIVKLDNTAGRRDVLTIAGNVEPKQGEFKSGIEERDGSATELITFSPPTGLNERQQFNMQIVIGALIGLTILAAGIVVIKKKVLDK